MEFKQAFDPIRSLKETFAAMNLAPAQLWGGGILLVFLDGCTSNTVQGGEGMPIPEELLFILLCLGCGLSLIAFLASTWFHPAVFHNLKSAVETGAPDERSFTDHRGLFVPLLLCRLLKGVIQGGITLLVMTPFIAAFIVSWRSGDEELAGMLFVGSLLFFLLVGLPTLIYLALGVALMPELVLYSGASPGESLARSWRLASGRRWQLLLYSLVTGLFSILGFLLCCVGVIATSAITRLAWGEAFLRWTEGGALVTASEMGDSDGLLEGDDSFGEREV